MVIPRPKRTRNRRPVAYPLRIRRVSLDAVASGLYYRFRFRIFRVLDHKYWRVLAELPGIERRRPSWPGHREKHGPKKSLGRRQATRTRPRSGNHSNPHFRRLAFRHPELRGFVLAALRADFAVLKTYAYSHEPPFDFPVRVYGGADDPLVAQDDLGPWAAQTRAAFCRRVFPGRHFYFQEQGEALLADVADACRSVL